MAHNEGSDISAEAANSPTPMRDLTYRPQIDGLRALAILGVLYSHLYNLDSRLGHYGVRLFFVISGYLITAILLRCRSARDQGKTSTKHILRSFYIRRALRIYPAYYALLFLAGVANVQNIRPSLLFHALYLSNILFAIKGAYIPWVTAHFWSLSVEEQFYLAWPLLILLMPKRLLTPSIIGTATIALVFRIVTLLTGTSDFFRWYLTPSSLDALAAGALLASFRARGDWPRWLLPAGWIAIFVYAVPLLGLSPHPVLSEILETVSLLPLMGLVALSSSGIRGILGDFLQLAPMLYLGRISYGVYLFHNFVVMVLFHFAPKESALSARAVPLLLIGSLLSILLATLSWFGLEQPFNRLKYKFPYLVTRPSQPSTPAANKL